MDPPFRVLRVGSRLLPRKMFTSCLIPLLVSRSLLECSVVVAVVVVESRSSARAATACRPAKHPRITASSFPQGRHFSSWRMLVRFHAEDRFVEQVDPRCRSACVQFDPFGTSSQPFPAQRSERFARLRSDPFFLLLAPFRSLSFPVSFLRVRRLRLT